MLMSGTIYYLAFNTFQVLRSPPPVPNLNVFACCIPGKKSGILRIQYGHAATTATGSPPPQRFSFGRDNFKNILVRPFKFGMWVYMGNATNAIVL